MHEVSLRLRTPEGVHTGIYHVSDIESLKRLEQPRNGLHAVEEAVYATGLPINPFDVTEAVASCDVFTFHYVRR